MSSWVARLLLLSVAAAVDLTGGPACIDVAALQLMSMFGPWSGGVARCGFPGNDDMENFRQFCAELDKESAIRMDMYRLRDERRQQQARAARRQGERK